MEANLFTSIEVIGTDDRSAPRHSGRVPAERKTSLRMVPPAGDPTVRIGTLRREWPACLSDGQQMARFQASPHRMEREGETVRVQSRGAEEICADSDRHNNCSTEVAETNPKTIQPSSDDEAVAAPGSSSIPSQPPRGPDFRDLARFEWRVPQPTRRNTQCVPI